MKDQKPVARDHARAIADRVRSSEGVRFLGF